MAVGRIDQWSYMIVALCDLLKHVFLGADKGRVTPEEDKHHHATSPGVHRFTVRDPPHHLRRHILGGPYSTCNIDFIIVIHSTARFCAFLCLLGNVFIFCTEAFYFCSFTKVKLHWNFSVYKCVDLNIVERTYCTKYCVYFVPYSCRFAKFNHLYCTWFWKYGVRIGPDSSTHNLV